MRSFRSIKTRRGFHGGPETEAHREIKKLAGLLFSLDGWLVFPETGHADLVVCKGDGNGLRMLAVEAELRATRHLLVNIRRDLRNGSEGVLVVAPSQAVCVSIGRLIDKALTTHMRERVVVTSLSQIRDDIEQITEGRKCRLASHTEPPDKSG